MRLRSGTFKLLAIIGLLCCGSLIPSAVLSASLSSGLQRSLADNASESISALVFFEPDVESSVALKSATVPVTNFGDRYKMVRRSVVSSSKTALDRFSNELSRSSASIEIKKSYWIANAILVEATPRDLALLAEFESVELIVEDAMLELVDPIDVAESPTVIGGAEENLLAIKADKLWAMGYTGAGRLVMSFDTGVDGSHPGLASRWRGITAGDPASAWLDPFNSEFPDDNSGHGTHVMGLMAGVFEGDTVGVAPDAEWACAAVVDRGSGFTQTISDILSAFEWAADPDGNPETTDDLPDAICHSWGIPKGIFAACDNTFWQAIDNLEQLGIVNVFACGNEGPTEGTIRNPADRASSPLSSFSVGAVNHAVDGYPVANFSSRGPANCDSTIIKPEVVAPGVNIKSLKPGGTTKYMSGTSMAAPHVAGAVALLRQYNPDATVEQIKHALLISALDIDEPGEDNASGMGLIDIENAINYMPAPTHAAIMYQGYQLPGDANGIIEPFEVVQLSVDVLIGNYDVGGLWGVLQTYESGVTILSDSAYYGSLFAGNKSANQSQPFVVQADQYVTPGTVITFRIDFFDENGEFLNNAYFDVVIAQSKFAASGSINNGQLSVGSCNYGAVGLGAGSMIDKGEAGFSIDSIDYLTEFALIISDDEGNVSDAVRNTSGRISDNDFVAEVETGLLVNPVTRWGDAEVIGSCIDDLAEAPIGLHVEQRVSMFSDVGLESTAFVRYTISLTDPFASKSICAGIAADVDFSGLELLGLDPSRNLMYYFNSELGKYVGIGMIGGAMHSFEYFSNPLASKSGLSDAEKADAVWSGEISELPTKLADYGHFMSMPPVTIAGGESVELVAVIIWASSEADLMLKYDDAYDKYMVPTSADDDDGTILPESFTLSQNYPNPFNPATTICFSVARSQDVTLSVYNILGQKVRTLVEGETAIGTHEVLWNGSDDSGSPVASGIYFYRLDTADGQSTRKMMLLK
ncbi:MAG: S8 family serine peptidase [candidate division Zixibacteria bacterium]|nr:S8 family serine peptidase [candidate division Zixibacteria bacterium]